MYVVTFYSYKGGVGRTMALANVAALLAQAGKRVLMVDFDLEAPGLPSYAPFRCAGAHPGLVEYIGEYLDTGAAPDAADFIVERNLGDHPIWLMPAGQHTGPDYAARYSSINWKTLYEQEEGFLLFEDLKQQWAEFDGKGFDYVLIDSRTGHTDIGGICTRQLPDAVVVMFLPTPQNVEGLVPIVRAIRNEGPPVRREKVLLHFCPANLPDLDDQEQILGTLLGEAAHQLGYRTAAAEIYHYGALELLQQPLYVLSSPKSRLTRNYRKLYTTVISHNMADRDGALIAIERLEETFETARLENDHDQLQRMQNDAAYISARFPDDPDIAWGLAGLAQKMTRPEDALAALTVVAESDSPRRRSALAKRAGVLSALDRRTEALADLEQLLVEEETSLFEVRPAIELLRSLVPDDWRTQLERAVANPRLDTFARYEILLALLTDRSQAARIVDLAAHHAVKQTDQQPAKIAHVLALIADGRFKAAQARIGHKADWLLERGSSADLFNFAYCEWALSGVPPAPLFRKVLERSDLGRTTDPNTLQCHAVARYVLDDAQGAIADLINAEVSARRVTFPFSCWRYLTVSSAGMLEDLAEMRGLLEAGVAWAPPGREGLKGTNASHSLN